ncbi:uncharacterized protein E0L32_010377 [Thyridium curvatum]|uniref:Heterokaryon incompatibility domain-containing protein n=1 Tax=Thyridium curvatum TaxID=1093900 RepID=A0A507AGI3_9PEZI|nr:uncharacterized protein E0L32_010377 [Thyridium curvatum]TPX07922.1 hypothetical protein E0L32_010377 [Thyridium curvatum]
MPTRLLDLGNEGAKTWRIIESQGQDRVEYIALSHRWSKSTPELLSSNYEAYHEHQPDSILPQDYQDVISICRAIPIRYLWIDSLCIVQKDGGFDFRREAPMMIDIYQHAYLTLMICWDFAGTSIFRKCSPRSIPRPRPPQSDDHDLHDLSNLDINPDDFVFVTYREDFSMNTEDASINTRAWVLQERYLSKRILYLGNDQLYWECDGEGNGHPVLSELFSKIIESSGRQSATIPFGGGREPTWNQIIQKYTACQLTYEEDRVVAIAGLARVLSKRTGETYFAGIWLEHWAHDLLWATTKERVSSSGLDVPNTKQSTTPTSTPPSWSWLSFSGTVRAYRYGYWRSDFLTTKLNSFELDDVRPLAMLTGSIISPQDSDPFTFFDQAILKIKCLLIPVEFNHMVDKNHFLGQLSIPFNPRILYHDEIPSGLNFLQLTDEYGDGPTFEVNFSRPVDPSSACYFLPVVLEKENFVDASADTFHNAIVAGLLIQQTLERDKQEFTRVGTLLGKEDEPSISPLISNTIVRQGIGSTPSSLNTQDETAFESKLGNFAADMVSCPVPVYCCDIDIDMEDGSRNSTSDGEGDSSSDESIWEMVECSSLPYFATAKWTTILLV